MEVEKVLEKSRDAIIGEIREEFKEFKAEVRGQLKGFKPAIEHDEQKNMELGDKVFA